MLKKKVFIQKHSLSLFTKYHTFDYYVYELTIQIVFCQQCHDNMMTYVIVFTALVTMTVWMQSKHKQTEQV